MHVSVESIGSLGRKLSVSVPAERLESAVGNRLRELSRTVRIALQASSMGTVCLPCGIRYFSTKKAMPCLLKYSAQSYPS